MSHDNKPQELFWNNFEIISS